MDALVESFLPFLRRPANLIEELIYKEFHRTPPEKHVSTLETSMTFAYELLLFDGLTSPQA